MYDSLIVVGVILFVIYLTPLFFVGADLWAGIRKAKERGEIITSDKTRRTIGKINRYYNTLLALSIIDVLQVSCLWYMREFHGWHTFLFPVVTMIGAICIGLIEVKSIIEPATAKERKQAESVAKLAKKLMEHKDDPVKLAGDVVDYMSEKEEKD